MTDPEKKIQLFDEWPDTYDRWFTTPIGGLVYRSERDLLMDLIGPVRGRLILDAGCGTGMFTVDLLSRGSRVIGVDISLPMLRWAGRKCAGQDFRLVHADMLHLPFASGTFDLAVSVTALEFIADGEGAVREMFRITRPGGSIVAATLNRLSPWAERRRAEAAKKHSIFEQAIFRSPEELLSLAPGRGLVRTAVHFHKEEDPLRAEGIEKEGWMRNSMTGAFVAALWEKT